ncbi:glycoside hydrolase [Clostridium lacusfryxellense]|uniref:glycoside hydrolase n=1 Tax=Clostridium lacusfryxellense TaxID=205328 RepID=UPI001C0B5471|nr:glycoside hydrolase [Clostridium lacusfryxellense]MBU3113316.1 glycoside hydrolase [Clostridium lacusfryxellense]
MNNKEETLQVVNNNESCDCIPNIWLLSDRNLEVKFDGKSNTISVKDKRVNKIWEQMPLNGLTVHKVSQSGNILKLELNGSFAMCATVELTEKSELIFCVTSDSNVSFNEISFPAAFRTPSKDHYLLQTDSEGLLLPVDDTFYPLEQHPLFFCGGGAAMAWIGVTDSAIETGYMAIFETPFDAAIELKRENGLITFSPVWLSSMGKFSYERKVRYVFFDKGGYIAQCKRYKEYIWAKNKVVKLKEKQKRFPAIEKILGAVHIYVWDKAREVSFAKKIKKAGIDKALILWDANHLPYPEVDYDSRLKEIGYATGAYELFTDIHPDSYAGNAEITDIPLKRNVYPELFDKITSLKEDGSRYSNTFGTYVCPEAVRPEIIKRVEKELKIYPHETYFLDVYQANGLYECYNPEHRLTRKQYAEAIIKNYELIEDKYNIFLGGEFGSDFVGSHGVFAHGMMTLQRTWFGSDVEKKGTIYNSGDWSNNERPSYMLGVRTAPDTYLKYSINEYTRVPLYELVYHDAVVTSWRWEDCNHHCPEIWWKKDLFNILYGTAPLWSIDQERWESFSVTFVESYKKICTWLQQICYDELMSHRFVNAERTIQETQFSSGKRAVVNFGDTPYTFEGQIIEPRGFITLEK